jgi:hypothetical protein
VLFPFGFLMHSFPMDQQSLGAVADPGLDVGLRI